MCHWIWHNNSEKIGKVIKPHHYKYLLEDPSKQGFSFGVLRFALSTDELCLRSLTILRYNNNVPSLDKLKDLVCAHYYAVAVSDWFSVLSLPTDPAELWGNTIFMLQTNTSGRFMTRICWEETLENLDESWLLRGTRPILRRDKEKSVISREN